MALRLADLLDDPGLGLALVAGRAGLDERGPVRWAHISEIPDPTPWLEGGEILLTTGLAIGEHPDLQRRLIAGLDERGCVGVGFGLGVFLDQVPEALRDEAERRRMPLFTVPYEVPFIAVTKRVSHHVFGEHYRTLRNAVDLHRRMLSVVIGGGGVAAVIETVGRPLDAFACVALDYYGKVLGLHDPIGRLDAVEPGKLWEAVAPERHEHDRFEATVGDHVVTAGVVRLGDEVQAVVAVVGDRPCHEHEALLLEQGMAGLSLELARSQSVREAHRARVDELLDEVAADRVGATALERQLPRLGFDLERGYHVLCLRSSTHNGGGGPVPGTAPDRVLCMLAEEVLAADGEPIVGRWNDAVFCVVQPGRSAHGERIAAAASARGWLAPAIGRSAPKESLAELGTALREAAAAAVSTDPGRSGVADVTALGIGGLLAGIDEGPGAAAFVEHVLGPVLAHDEREATPLAETLRAYLRHGCRPGPAAAELGVHRHTLAYRLDRIANLTGRDPRDGTHLLDFALALELAARASAGRETR
jgi:PucR family transcriptional regulator, purine catabolism regulatory protein